MPNKRFNVTRPPGTHSARAWSAPNDFAAEANVRGILLRTRTLARATALIAIVGLGSACSDSEDSPLAPDDLTVGEVGSPVDTVSCRSSYELVYEYREVRVYGDMLLRELDVVLDLVNSNLLSGEEVSFVDRPGYSVCRRLIYSTNGDIVAQTCRGRDSSNRCTGGRFFSFARVEDALVLQEVGEWLPPGDLADP